MQSINGSAVSSSAAAVNGSLIAGSRDESILPVIKIADILGASTSGGDLSQRECELLDLARDLADPADARIAEIQSAISAGGDPFSEAFVQLRSADARRTTGTFFTPCAIVAAMINWIADKDPARIIDAGAGTGRFAAAAADTHPNAEIIAIESDPIVSLLCRAHLAQRGIQATVINTDFLRVELPKIQGPTAFVGNPPYVRHHDLNPSIKDWASDNSRQIGRPCSQLAGLHIYFFLATALKARKGDVGCYVTSAEWLDVGYGEFLRWLLLERLGLESLHVLRADAAAFEDAMTTAAITCFRPASKRATIRVRHINSPADFGNLTENGKLIEVEPDNYSRWGPAIRNGDAAVTGSDSDEIPMGTFARVHRGIATGANKYFVLPRDKASDLKITDFAVPCIARAREVIRAGEVIRASDVENVLISIPPEIAFHDLPPALRAYLERAESDGVADRYLCRHRTPWWSVGRHAAPPIVMTYMGRGKPAFAHNPDGLLLLNVVHGIYPRATWSSQEQRRLVRSLNRQSEGYKGTGRTYHGGLEKFEPSEAEALPVPRSVIPDRAIG